MAQTITHHASTKPSELYRERIVARYYHATHPLRLFDPDGAPQSSQDTALNAFAQLAALRLDANRAMISLIDSRHQFILAEATRSLSSQSDQRHKPSDGLWLGCTVIPRTMGICARVLEPVIDPDPKGEVTIIHALHELPGRDRFPPIPGAAVLQFYAGVPISRADGTKVGSYCILDDKPRVDLSEDEKDFLRDMAKTVMEHLESVRLRMEHQRRHQFLRSLESFVNGGATLLKSLSEEENPAIRSGPGQIARITGLYSSPTDPGDHAKEGHLDTSLPLPSHPTRTKQPPLWESALPPGSKAMFRQAAANIRQGGEYDGVVFFYLSSTPTKSLTAWRRMRESASRPRRQSASSDSSVESASPPSARSTVATQNGDQKSRLSTCPILSMCRPEECPVDDAECSKMLAGFQSDDLFRLLGESPRARTYNIVEDQQLCASDSSSAGSGVEQSHDVEIAEADALHSPKDEADDFSRPTRGKSARLRSLQKLDPTGRSFVCLPLWDFERQRWLAYAVCWTTSPHRDLDLDGDLQYLRVFGNSIMNSFAHLDTLAVSRAKTTFVSSISHELRSPLHGMLGATSFLDDSHLDAFQREMVNSITSSGRTLLDTIDHVLDFATLNASLASQRPSSRSASAQSASGGMVEPPSSNGMPSDVSTDVAELVEEVVEAIYMGHTVWHDFLEGGEDVQTGTLEQPLSSNGSSRLHRLKSNLRGNTRVRNQRNHVRIALRITHQSNWCFRAALGGLRRIVLNLVGNAIKYTDHGLITIQLQPAAVKQRSSSTASSLDENSTSVALGAFSLTVTDTGRGMSQDFLENRIFLPFSQEDSFVPGTGLGLSIVHHLVQSMNGSMKVASTKGVGTRIQVYCELPMGDRAPSSNVGHDAERFKSIPTFQPGLRVCVLECAEAARAFAGDVKSSAEIDTRDSLLELLSDWMQVEATVTSEWVAQSADLVIFLRPSFKQLETLRGPLDGSMPGPPVIIVAHDTLEMAALRVDARITDFSSHVEIITQPIGPRKLARALKRSLDAPPCLSPAATAHSRQNSPDFQRLQVPRAPSPRKSRSPAPVPQAQGRIPKSSFKPSNEPKVLIVDDNPLNLRLLSAFLKKLQIAYSEAQNGQEAVDNFVAAGGSIQCVLMDISMPVMDGVTATRHIRAHEQSIGWSPIPILALTGLASAAAQSEANEAGINVFLTKPISFATLKQKLPEHLLATKAAPKENDHGIPPSESITPKDSKATDKASEPRYDE